MTPRTVLPRPPAAARRASAAASEPVLKCGGPEGEAAAAAAAATVAAPAAAGSEEPLARSLRRGRSRDQLVGGDGGGSGSGGGAFHFCESRRGDFQRDVLAADKDGAERPSGRFRSRIDAEGAFAADGEPAEELAGGPGVGLVGR